MTSFPTAVSSSAALFLWASCIVTAGEIHGRGGGDDEAVGEGAGEESESEAPAEGEAEAESEAEAEAEGGPPPPPPDGEGSEECRAFGRLWCDCCDGDAVCYEGVDGFAAWCDTDPFCAKHCKVVECGRVQGQGCVGGSCCRKGANHCARGGACM